ncbi:MAG: DnaA regulatory inactivator Hda [Methylococcales bacterium]
MTIQIPLPFTFHDILNFDAYFEGPNRQIVESLKALARKQSPDPFLYIQGDPGFGKSHLLQATCGAASRLDCRVFYLPLRDDQTMNPTILDGLESYRLVCFDDIDSIAGKPDWETAFFHFFNRHREQSNYLLVSARLSPNKLPIALSDLRSRLQSALTLVIQELADPDKLEALTLKAKNLGFHLPKPVGRFLLSRYPRDLPTLWKILATLDYASLSEQRKLTIPFLKSHLPER